MKTHPRECDCRTKAPEQVEVLREQSRHEGIVSDLKKRYLSEKAIYEWNFKKNHGESTNTETARFCVKHQEEMKRDNIGLLFWGEEGTGNSDPYDEFRGSLK